MNQVGQIRKGRKFDQVLEGARSVFLADGFEGANVDDIAREAGVSKATLYNYFPDKRLLFMEVASTECLRQARLILDSIDMSRSVRDVLSEGGRKFLRFITSDFGVQMFRICVAEGERFPEIGRQFFRSGPQNMQNELVCFFEEAIERGELRMEDPALAAFQFGELCKADAWMKLMFNMIDDVSDAHIDHVVDNAVDTFMARYGV